MVSEFVIESSEGEIDQRRCTGHRLQYLLAARDHILNLEPKPTPLVITKDVVCREVKFEDLAGLVSRTGRKDLPEEISEDAEKDNYKHGKADHQQHRRDHSKGENVLTLLLYRRRLPFLYPVFR